MAEKHTPPLVPPHESHGNSIAAWSAVSIVALGFLLLVIAWVSGEIPLYVAGVLVIIAGGVAGKVLSAMGFGESHKPAS